MDMEGHRHLAVTQQQAWDALNDPEVLKTCIPGCDRIESTGADQYNVGVSVRVGPVAAKFNGKIALANVQAPNSYTITFDGQGGPAGFGKGIADVRLSPPDEGAGCELAYKVNAQVGGKIAQVGQRLIDGVAKSMAEDFFKRFDDEMQRRHPQAYAVDSQLAHEKEPVPGAVKRPAIPVWAWAVGAVVAVAALWLLLRR